MQIAQHINIKVKRSQRIITVRHWLIEWKMQKAITINKWVNKIKITTIKKLYIKNNYIKTIDWEYKKIKQLKSILIWIK